MARRYIADRVTTEARARESRRLPENPPPQDLGSGWPSGGVCVQERAEEFPRTGRNNLGNLAHQPVEVVLLLQDIGAEDAVQFPHELARQKLIQDAPLAFHGDRRSHQDIKYPGEVAPVYNYIVSIYNIILQTRLSSLN